MIFIFENFIKKIKPFSSQLSFPNSFYMPAFFLFITTFFSISSIFNDSPLCAQQRNPAKKNAAAGQTRAPEVKKNINAAAPQYSAPLFDAEFESEITDINFIKEITDEIEFRRIYKALSDDIGKLKEALAKAVASAGRIYNGCLTASKNKYARELKAAEIKIKQNNDPGRIESLNSLLLLLKQEQKDYYKAEADKTVNIFKSIFDSFLNAYHIQKYFLTVNTAYESSTSEIMTALDTFEIYIKNKNERIEKYIYDKFDKIVSGAGDDHK